MFRYKIRAAAALVVLWLGTLASASAVGNFTGGGSFLFDQKTKTEVRLFSPFEGVPSHGFLPVKVVIKNGFNTEQSWSISFRSYCDSYGHDTEYTSSYSFTVAANSEIEDEVMVPLTPIFADSYSSHYVEAMVTMQRGGRNFRGNLSSRPLSDWPTVGMSEGIEGKHDNLDKLTTTAHSKFNPSGSRSSSGEPVAMLFDARELVRDWRGYIGFDALMMTDAEWIDLEPAIRRSLLEWNRFGGRLMLVTDTAGRTLADLGIPNSTRGLGQVSLERWNGEELNFSVIANKLANQTPRKVSNFANDYVGGWKLQQFFGTRPFNPTLVFIILVAFAIAVGPVNLFVLAKPGMRHRMFLTTPVISLAASMLLILIILFQDGFGGSGSRNTFMMLESQQEERSAYLIQEQISRTGVLLGRSFSPEDPTYVTPVVMGSSRWTHFDNEDQGNARYRFAGGTIAGDWFRSRSEQAHYSQKIQPTRARIERLPSKASGEPRLFSSMDMALEELFYIDASGKYWEAKGRISPGQEVELKEADKAVVEKFWQDATETFSASLRARILNLAQGEDLFLALGKSDRDHMIATLPSIRWKNDKLLVVGTPVARDTSTENE